MYYSDISCNVKNTFIRLDKLGFNKILHSSWIGLITVTQNGKLVLDGSKDYENIGTSNVVNLLIGIKDELQVLEESKIVSGERDGNKYNLIISPIREYNSYKIFFVTCSLSKEYNADDLDILNLITKISYENVLLNNEVEKERNYLQNIFDSTESAFIILSLTGEITKVNKSVYDELGIHHQDLIGKSFYDYVSGNQKRVLQKDIISIIHSNKRISYKDIIFVNKVSGKIVVNVTVSPLNDGQNHVNGVVIVVTDVTKKKILEKELEQVKQIALLGDVSADIAHEVKNPLMGIRGCARILQKNIEKNTKQHDFIESIITEVDRANEAIEQFLSYARMNKEDSNTLIDINGVLEKCSDLLFFYKENKYIIVNKDLSQKLPRIKGNVVRLQQAFINILINSIQAIKVEGIITIKTYCLETMKEIVVEISDNGVGIGPDKIDRIFDPYFTTKEEGTGLGLSITKKIVEKNDGEISVSSEENSWTKFKITFPYKELIN